VDVVQRVINNNVYFLYADDLNNVRTQTEIQQLIKTHSPPEFYPPMAKWMYCKSTTYQPHLNECGPRTLFALAAMAMHPNPTPEILLPFMHPNLAQILRTWVATSLLLGQVPIPTWDTHATLVHPGHMSCPTYLFPWNHSIQPTGGNKTKQSSKRKTGPTSPATTSSQPHHTPEILPTAPILQGPIKTSTSVAGRIQLTIHDAFKLPPPPDSPEYDAVWGHFPESIDDSSTLRILFTNPKGIKLSSDILETEYSLGRCHSLRVGALCVAESNVNWENLRAFQKFHGLLRKVWKHSKVSKSFIKDEFISENQPGGTVTMVYNKWTSRVIESGEDPFGLGRWSFLTLQGRGNIKVILVTAYRVCKQTVQSVDPRTSTAQQFRVLSQQFREADRLDDPIPRHQFIVDLQGWLEHKTADGYYIILGIDANEAFDSSGGNYTPVDYQIGKPISTKDHDGTLSTLVRTSGLVDPLLIHHPDTPPSPTYDRGKEKRDFLFVSAGLLPYIARTGIFPYNSLFTSDHRPCYLDLDSTALFQEDTPVIGPPQHPGLQLQDPRLVEQYTEELLAQLRYHKVLPKVEQLQKKAEQGIWTQTQTQECEKVDTLVTEAMLKAERAISKKNTDTYQWSPALKAAITTLTGNCASPS